AQTFYLFSLRSPALRSRAAPRLQSRREGLDHEEAGPPPGRVGTSRARPAPARRRPGLADRRGLVGLVHAAWRGRGLRPRTRLPRGPGLLPECDRAGTSPGRPALRPAGGLHAHPGGPAGPAPAELAQPAALPGRARGRR